MKNSNRQAKREALKKQQLQRRILTIGGISLAVIAVIVIIVLAVNKSPGSTGLLGEEVLIQSADHVSEDTQPGPYNSNPPAGGNHFEEDFSAKFYQEIRSGYSSQVSRGLPGSQPGTWLCDLLVQLPGSKHGLHCFETDHSKGDG